MRGRRRSLPGAQLRVKALGDQLAPAKPPGAGGGGAHSCSETPAPAAPHNSSPVPGTAALPSHNIPNCAGLKRPTQRPHSHPAEASSAAEINTLRPRATAVTSGTSDPEAALAGRNGQPAFLMGKLLFLRVFGFFPRSPPPLLSSFQSTCLTRASVRERPGHQRHAETFSSEASSH